MNDAVGRIVHVAIDVQKKFTKELYEARRETYPREVRLAADDLRSYGIPTIWVAFRTRGLFSGLDWNCYANQITEPNAPVKKAEDWTAGHLGLPDVHQQDLIFVKNKNNAFHGHHLPDLLNAYGYKTLLFSGMNTCCCLASTVSTSAQLNYNTYVFLDLLADGSPYYHEGRERGKIAAHQGLLYDCLSEDQVKKVRGLISHKFTNELSRGVAADKALQKSRPIRDVAPTRPVRRAFRAFRAAILGRGEG